MDWSGSVEKDKARNSDKPFLASQTHLECTDYIIETITEEVCNTFFDNFTKILRGHLRAGAPSFEWTILLLTVHMQLFELVSMPF